MALTAKGTPYVVSTDLVANYPTVSSDLADHIDDNLTYNAQTINAQTGSGANAYTFALADATLYKLVTASNAATATYTVPPQSSVTWVDGNVLRILNIGAGVVTLAGGSGVTLSGSDLNLAQNDYAQITRTGSNAWTVNKFGGGGKILQVVRATDGTSRTTTSTTYVDASISVTITPTKSTSNIILIWAALVESPTTGAVTYLRITDNSNNAISGAEETWTNSNSGVINNMTTAIAYASPATTSATTYKGRFRVSSGTGTLRNASTTGQLYAIEVSA